MNDQPTPTHPAVEQLRHALRGVERGDLDPLSSPWSELESGVARLLGGPFSPAQSEHAGVALLVAAAFGERVCRDLSGFWFANRAVPGGAAVGFGDATIMFSPVEVVVEALSRARLTMLDDVAKDLGGALARSRLDPTAPTSDPGATPLGPEEYRRMFDPGFVQLACVDLAKVRTAVARTAPEAAREIEDALGRLPAAVPAAVRASVRDQIVGALSGLPPMDALSACAAKAPPLVELLALLEGTLETTRFAPAELWQHVLLPLLHIGPAESFPALDEEDQDALRQGADPLVVYVETLPFRTPAADEDGVLGVFPTDALGPVAPCLAGLPAARAATVPAAALAAVVATFDRTGLRQSVERFTRHALEQARAAGGDTPSAESELLPIALELLGELARVVEAVAEGAAGERALVIRRAPEAEASSDATLQELRRALQGSRIILI